MIVTDWLRYFTLDGFNFQHSNNIQTSEAIFWIIGAGKPAVSNVMLVSFKLQLFLSSLTPTPTEVESILSLCSVQALN